ncbi:hypothetical protein F4780DRAFT_4483 [Xylariomycetidae sp. FL0641]|nr:hypothetical protein F4780DRAFT_4483 [Xylariomycetidae sp. FL0641]
MHGYGAEGGDLDVHAYVPTQGGQDSGEKTSGQWSPKLHCAVGGKPGEQELESRRGAEGVFWEMAILTYLTSPSVALQMTDKTDFRFSAASRFHRQAPGMFRDQGGPCFSLTRDTSRGTLPTRRQAFRGRLRQAGSVLRELTNRPDETEGHQDQQYPAFEWNVPTKGPKLIAQRKLEFVAAAMSTVPFSDGAWEDLRGRDGYS